MSRTMTFGAVLFLFFGLLLLSTYPVYYDRHPITLDDQSQVSGEINLALPRKVYLGQSAKVTARIELSEVDASNLPTVITARLESSIDELSPRGEVLTAVTPGTPLVLIWKVKPYQSADYPGMLWISARGEEGEQLLLAREVIIKSRTFLFTRVENIRILSALMMSAGVAILLFGTRRWKNPT